MSTVEERVMKVVAEQLDLPQEKITKESHFIDDLGADSLDTVELLMAFEDEFELNIEDDQAEKIQTVGDAIKHISEHLG